jgi:hypothetical protein
MHELALAALEGATLRALSTSANPVPIVRLEGAGFHRLLKERVDGIADHSADSPR